MARRTHGGLPEDLTRHGPCFERACLPYFSLLGPEGPYPWHRPWNPVAPLASLPSPQARPRLFVLAGACSPPHEGNPGLTPGFPSGFSPGGLQ